MARRVARGRGDALDDGASKSGTPWPVLAEIDRTSLGGQPEHSLELLLAALGVGRGQVDLVQDGDDLEIVFDRLVAVGQGLGLDALAGVDEQDGPLAGRQGARDLVAEVDVARCVDELDDVALVLQRARSGP